MSWTLLCEPDLIYIPISGSFCLLRSRCIDRYVGLCSAVTPHEPSSCTQYGLKDGLSLLQMSLTKTLNLAQKEADIKSNLETDIYAFQLSTIYLPVNVDSQIFTCNK